MAATAGPNVFHFAICFVEVAERKPAFSSSDVQQIVCVKWTPLSVLNLFHRSQIKRRM